MEIYTYGNTEAVIGVLHYLVMLFGTNDFMDIVRTAIVIGFIVAACASVMQMTHRGWTWLLTVMLVYAICFIPKTSVLVTDKLAIEPPAAVANVPWLAGFLFSIKSQIGHTLVQLTETALQTIPNPKYSLPAELAYEQHGVAFGNRLVRETRAVSLPDTQLRADVIAYIRNCVYPEVGKSLDATALAKAIPLWPALAVTNPALVTTYTPIAGVLSVSPCPDVYNLITARLPSEATSMLETVAANVSPGVALASAVAAVGPAVEAAYIKTQLANASLTVGDILLHNAMINHFAETGQVMATAASDPAAVLMSMAKSQATAQANASYMLQARMADEASPVIRNVIEILLLGAFPLVCVMLLVTEGRRTVMFIVGYLYALVWVELWPFTYAILNYVHTLYAAKEVAASAFVNPGNALTLLTSGIVYSTVLSTSAIAGWMILAVPTLSAALLWGFDKIVGAVPSLASMLGGAGHAAAAAAVGNVSQGAVSFGQQSLSPQRSSAYFRSAQEDLTGDTRIFGMSGVEAVRALQNDTFFAGAVQAQQATRLASLSSTASEVGDREAQAAAIEASAAWGELLTKGKGRSTIQDLAGVVGRDQATSDSQAWRDISSVAHGVHTRWGVTEMQAASLIASARAGIGLRPDIGVGAQLSNEQQAAIRRDYEGIQRGTTAQETQATQDFLRRLSTSEQYRNAVITNQEDREQLSARLERASRHSHIAEASFANRDTLQQSAELAYSQARSLGYDFIKDPQHTRVVDQLTRDARSNPSSIGIALEQELARFGQLSQPVQYADGTSAYQDPAARYAQMKPDPRFADQSTAVDTANRGRLGPVGTAPVAPPSSLQGAANQIEAARQNVQRKGAPVSAEVAELRDDLDKRLDRLDGEHGEFGTNQSLANKVADNFGNDVKATNIKAADAVLKIFGSGKK